MSQFTASTYKITTWDGTPVIALPFKSAEAICNRVRLEHPGIYHVFRLVPNDQDGTLLSEFWGDVTNHGGGLVIYELASPE